MRRRCRHPRRSAVGEVSLGTSNRRGPKTVVRTAGIEPALSYGEADFRTTSAFAAAAPDRAGVRGLDYPFAIAAAVAAGLRRRPSSLYTFPGAPGLGSGSARAIGPELSPNLSGSAPRVSLRALQVKSAASTRSATSARGRHATSCRPGRAVCRGCDPVAAPLWRVSVQQG